MACIFSSALPSLQQLLVKYILRAGQTLDTEINKEDIRRANGLTKEARQQSKYIKKHKLQKVLKEMNKGGQLPERLFGEHLRVKT